MKVKRHLIVGSLLLCLFSTSLCAESLSEEEQWEFVGKKLVFPVTILAYGAIPAQLALSVLSLHLLMTVIGKYFVDFPDVQKKFGQTGAIAFALSQYTLFSVASYKGSGVITDEVVSKAVLALFLKNWEAGNKEKTPALLRPFFEQKNMRSTLRGR